MTSNRQARRLSGPGGHHAPDRIAGAQCGCAGGRVLIKAECLQRTGSFKFRGAWNCISRLVRRQRKGGVVAYSSGNHAQGVAAAAQMMKLPALIVMPADTPEIKQANTRSYGAEVVTYDRATEDREAIANRIAARARRRHRAAFRASRDHRRAGHVRP